MANKAATEIDRRIGVRLRMRRLTLDMSQEQLAVRLGVTFQQVQKYEKGHNRIGAGRLQQFAEILQVPVSFFFEDFAAPGATQAPSSSELSDFLATADGQTLTRALMNIRDAGERHCIVILLEAMARE